MNERTRRYLHDALQEATALQKDLAGKSFHNFSKSRHLLLITERSLEIIGEALRRALDEDSSLMTNEVRLRDWVNMRNVISHQSSVF